MKNTSVVSLFAAILLLAANCFAGDYATLNVLGFSNDGRYLAFEEYGWQDGSGFPYATIYFIDTAKNAYAAPKVDVMIENESATETAARSRVAALAAKKLKQFRIVRGNTGRLILSHPLTDLTFEGEAAKKADTLVKFSEEVTPYHREGDYELLLTPVKVMPKECTDYGNDIFMLELKLTNNAGDSTSKFLQKDTSLPASRGCVMSYRIQDVYIYKGIIAVFMSFDTPGFEGPDSRFMAISGKLR
jgi:predicted secreted protein